jgi:hypothetical protein
MFKSATWKKIVPKATHPSGNQVKKKIWHINKPATETLKRKKLKYALNTKSEKKNHQQIKYEWVGKGVSSLSAGEAAHSNSGSQKRRAASSRVTRPCHKTQHMSQNHITCHINNSHISSTNMYPIKKDFFFHTQTHHKRHTTTDGWCVETIWLSRILTSFICTVATTTVVLQLITYIYIHKHDLRTSLNYSFTHILMPPIPWRSVRRAPPSHGERELALE